MIELSALKAGDQAVVIGYAVCQPAYRHKLMAMGLTRGQIIKVVRVAPLGDPVEIEVRGFNLSVRKREVAPLLLEKIQPSQDKS